MPLINELSLIDSTVYLSLPGSAQGLFGNFQSVANWTRTGTKPLRSIRCWKENLQLDNFDRLVVEAKDDSELQHFLMFNLY